MASRIQKKKRTLLPFGRREQVAGVVALSIAFVRGSGHWHKLRVVAPGARLS
jgi:hypothetical protein